MGNTFTDATTAVASDFSLLQLVNTALQRIGQREASDIDNPSTREETAVANSLESVLRDVLNEHRWNGPSKRAELTASGTDPAFEFDHAYELPSDYVRLNYTSAPESPHKIEGGHILSDESELFISYVSFTEDPDVMGPGLRKAFSYRLSAELTQLLTGDPSRYDMMMNRYRDVLEEARFMDSSQEGISRIGGSSWLNAHEAATTGGDMHRVGFTD